MNVRVIHRWTRPDIRDKTKTNSIELLLLDVENEIIQATIMRQLISFFGSKILVGKVYSIRNITVVDNLGPDKATLKPCRLKFEFSSKVQEITDTSISVHGYRFAKFEDIISRQSVNYSLHRYNVHCLGQWRIQTTYNASAYYVNPDIPEVNIFEESLSTPAASNLLQIIEIIDTPDDDDVDALSIHNIKTISDIKRNENAGFYYTHAKIIDLECTVGWYYDSCKLCWAKTIKNENGRWKCTRIGCDGSSSGLASRVPRFQVKFIVADTTDEEAAFVVFDSQITQFINHTVAELLAKIEKAGDHDSIPRELKAFIDKTFVFKIEIHDKYNVCNGSNSYTVLHMSDDVGLCEKWLAKYTELFKVELDSFKSTTKDMMVRVANVKVTKSSKSIDLSDVGANKLHEDDVHSHQDEDSVSGDTSPNITPLKRSFSRVVSENGELKKGEPEFGDACSATKKRVNVISWWSFGDTSRSSSLLHFVLVMVDSSKVRELKHGLMMMIECMS
ncbi:hypothetical protein RND81_04G084900 [Saponaria officinalis]|uniref:Replication protein A 70 kDa DNA-binding subunit B/D first OB fold domain-containing protein n=1 Tax=Saponaria officinalis TaxID=3572 RepID=A0AAW1LK21_SAPOF